MSNLDARECPSVRKRSNRVGRDGHRIRRRLDSILALNTLVKPRLTKQTDCTVSLFYMSGNDGE